MELREMVKMKSVILISLMALTLASCENNKKTTAEDVKEEFKEAKDELVDYSKDKKK